MTLSREEYENLVNDPRVQSVVQVGTKSIALYETLELINATRAHDTRLGSVNLTGAGETVCVIDTAANFSAPRAGRKEPDTSYRLHQPVRRLL